ncbi:MAG: hypothetical protein ACE5O2_05050 [Armatimonadota bacterium]
MPEEREKRAGLGCCSLLLLVVLVFVAWQIFGWGWRGAQLSLRYPWMIGLTVAVCNILAAIGFLGFAANLPSSTFWKVVFVTASLGVLAGSLAAYVLHPTAPARVFLQCYLVGLGVLYVGGGMVARRVRMSHLRRDLELLRQLSERPQDRP